MIKNIKIKQEISDPNKHKLKTHYMFTQHGFKIGFLNPFCARPSKHKVKHPCFNMHNLS
jgi:hypothetical protein